MVNLYQDTSYDFTLWHEYHWITNDANDELCYYNWEGLAVTDIILELQTDLLNLEMSAR